MVKYTKLYRKTRTYGILVEILGIKAFPEKPVKTVNPSVPVEK